MKVIRTGVLVLVWSYGVVCMMVGMFTNSLWLYETLVNASEDFVDPIDIFYFCYIFGSTFYFFKTAMI